MNAVNIRSAHFGMVSVRVFPVAKHGGWWFHITSF